MRILYLSQYFPPEVGATQTRAYEMARGLLLAGHDVTMIAELPNHPQGVIWPDYRGKVYERKNLDGIDVIRIWVKTAPAKDFRNRLAFYLSYMVMAIVAGLALARGSYDLIYATSPPLFVGGAALVISFFRRLPMVFEVRDLWPESAVVLGVLRNQRAIHWATRLEEACYGRAQRVVVTTEEMKTRLVERGIASDKIQVIRNGANTDIFRYSPEHRANIRAEQSWTDEFIVMYAGLMGIAQDLGQVLEAARRLATASPNVHFVLIGDGPVKAALETKASELGLQNVTFFPAQPRERIPRFLSAADAALAPLTRKRLIGALPSKMFDAMACQRPVILSAEGESCTVLKAADAGIIVPPGDAGALAEAVIKLQNDDRLRARLGRNGRDAVEREYSRQAQARQLEKLLSELVTERMGAN